MHTRRAYTQRTISRSLLRFIYFPEFRNKKKTVVLRGLTKAIRPNRSLKANVYSFPSSIARVFRLKTRVFFFSAFHRYAFVPLLCSDYKKILDDVHRNQHVARNFSIFAIPKKFIRCAYRKNTRLRKIVSSPPRSAQNYENTKMYVCRYLLGDCLRLERFLCISFTNTHIYQSPNELKYRIYNVSVIIRVQSYPTSYYEL